jgi:hypothetical protein
MTHEIELLFVEPTTREHFGLPVVLVDGEEYAVAETEEAAQSAAIESARDSLWAFNTPFLCRHLNLNTKQEEAIAEMQNKLCEDAGPILEALLGDKLDDFLADAVNTDGRGHFLSPYDSEEHDGEDISPALQGKLVYRL